MKPRQDFVACNGKNRYDDKKAAMTVINNIMRGHRRNRPDNLSAYPCSRCKGWHITSK